MLFAKHGYYILPLRPKCKDPILKDWRNNASNSIEQVNEWWKQTPDANIGLLTGKKNNLFVLDIDGEYPAQLPPLDEYLKVKTGRGYHYYFMYPNGLEIRNKSYADLKMDIRGDGGYIVAPPSIHESGVRYEFI